MLRSEPAWARADIVSVGREVPNLCAATHPYHIRINRAKGLSSINAGLVPGSLLGGNPVPRRDSGEGAGWRPLPRTIDVAVPASRYVHRLRTQALQHWLLLVQVAPVSLWHPCLVLPAGQHCRFAAQHSVPQVVPVVQTQIPVVGAQVWPLGQVTAVPAQTPAAVHLSLVVQGLSSLQTVPAALSSKPQMPPLQVAVWQAVPCGQVLAFWHVTQFAIWVPTHAPAALHWSLLVQALPSSHAPFSRTRTSQMPAWVQTAS